MFFFLFFFPNFTTVDGIYLANQLRFVVVYPMIDEVWDASKAAASACEKGGRWLLSLKLLREAKVGHVFRGGRC